MTTTDRLDGHRCTDAHGTGAVEAPNIPADHGCADAQTPPVGGDLNSEQSTTMSTSKARPSARANIPADQHSNGVHVGPVGGDPNIHSTHDLPDNQAGIGAVEQSPHPAILVSVSKTTPPGGASNIPADHTCADTYHARVGGDPNIHSTHAHADSHACCGAVEQSPQPATVSATSKDGTPGGASNTPDSHTIIDGQLGVAVGGLNSGDTQVPVDIHTGSGVAVLSPPTPTKPRSISMVRASVLGVADDQPATMSHSPSSGAVSLADPFLALAADILDDLERVRIANENRLRQLTRSELDSDGERRGLGFSPDDPAVAAIAGLVTASKALEDDAGKNLAKRLRKHPLGPWVKSMKGVGDKQAARLLAVVGDPYWHSRDNRPRTVSELRSYCGWGDARAQVRRKGEHAAWSDTAKKRTWVIADKCKIMLCATCKAARPKGRIWAEHVDGCTCSPYRVLYDDARRRYEGTLHDVECRRCGPKGKPASAGSPRSPGHQEAMALRIVAKTILRDLWREAKRLHGEASDDA